MAPSSCTRWVPSANSSTIFATFTADVTDEAALHAALDAAGARFGVPDVAVQRGA